MGPPQIVEVPGLVCAVYDEQTATLKLPPGGLWQAEHIVFSARRVQQELELQPGNAITGLKVSYSLQLEPGVWLPYGTDLGKVCGHCGAVVATAAVCIHVEHCVMVAWMDVIKSHVVTAGGGSFEPCRG